MSNCPLMFSLLLTVTVNTVLYGHLLTDEGAVVLCDLSIDFSPALMMHRQETPRNASPSSSERHTAPYVDRGFPRRPTHQWTPSSSRAMAASALGAH